MLQIATVISYCNPTRWGYFNDTVETQNLCFHEHVDVQSALTSSLDSDVNQQTFSLGQ